MLDFVTRPIRSALGIAEHEVVAPIQEGRDIEAHILVAVRAIHSATASIERHVEDRHEEQPGQGEGKPGVAGPRRAVLRARHGSIVAAPAGSVDTQLAILG